jgi:hypothetical protein
MTAGFDSVLVVVDHLTRMAHFFPSTEEITDGETTKVFFQGCTVYMAFYPLVLVSNKDPRFVSAFCQALWRRLGTKLNMPSSGYLDTCG